MQCKKCGSKHVNVQMVSEINKKHPGIIYWIFIGWWLEMLMWLFLTLPWLIIKIFKPNTHKEAICQDCGYSWKV